MQVTPILICLVLISIVQAALVTKIPKPKLNLVNSQHLQRSEILKHKSAEERRNIALFPNSYIKYVILSPELIYKIATQNPIVNGTKKALMKELNLHDKQNKVVENETVQPIISTEPMHEKKNAVTHKVDTVLVSEQVIIVVEDKSGESNEKQNDNSEEEDKLQNDSNEIKTVTVDTENKESLNLKDLIYPPIEKPIAVNTEKKNIQGFLDVFDSTKNSKDIEMSDRMEFILIAPEHKRTESDNISSEQPEEYVTTELYEEPEIVRRKRGSNVIVEENLASKVAGYKYTRKDTRLNNDMAFKNIHS